MVYSKKSILLSYDGFPWASLPRKERIVRILSHYSEMSSHEDRDAFYAFLKSQLDGDDASTSAGSLESSRSAESRN